MRKPMLCICIAVSLILFAQKAMAGTQLYVNQNEQGQNSPWGSYGYHNEQGQNDYDDTSHGNYTHQRNQHYGQNNSQGHNNNDSGHGNYNNQQNPPQGQYNNQRHDDYRPNGNWMNNINNKIIRRQFHHN